MKCFFLSVVLLFCNSITAQTTTFNKRIRVGCANTVLRGLEVTDSCYYVVGIARDTINCNPSTCFLKIDTLGNTNFYTIYENATPSPFFSPLVTTWDQNLMTLYYHPDQSTGSWVGGLLKFDEQGNGTPFTQIFNPNTTGHPIVPSDLKIMPDSGFIVTNYIADSIHSNTDIGIIRLDKYGNQQWYTTRGFPLYHEYGTRIYLDSDNLFTIGYHQDNLYITSSSYTMRSVIEGIDGMGNTQWIYQSPHNALLYGVGDFIQTKDNGWVVSSGLATEQINTGGAANSVNIEAYIYKLDSSRNFLWSKKFHANTGIRANFGKILELDDSSLVAFGSVINTYQQPNSYNIIHGLMVKLSPQGDSLWSRSYEYLTTQNAQHIIYDVECTADSGYLLCGHATSGAVGIENQQGWLLKLDEHGCLVPNCHIIPNSTNPIKKPIVDVLLYPNPAIDYLNIHYRNPRLGNELTFQVTDISGRVLNSYTTSDISDKTYIVPVYDLIKGIYIIEVLQDKEIVYVEQFVKT